MTAALALDLEPARTTVVHVDDPAGWDVFVGTIDRAHPDQRAHVRTPWRLTYRVGRPHPGLSAVCPVPMDLADTLELYETRHLARIRTALEAEVGAGAFAGRLARLAGRRLACNCFAITGRTLTAADPLVCHGQVLARLADEHGARHAH